MPYGECPLVCLGGHGQTGGYGHLLRNFGLALDYIISFTIVLADGTVRTVARPEGPPVTEDDEIFWGVLGGNAGSFGIITNYRLQCIKDVDFPESYIFARIQKYDQPCYFSLMKQAQEWTRGVAAGTLSPNIDYRLTVESKSETFLPPVPVILVELIHKNVPGAAENAEQLFQPIIQAAESGTSIWAYQRVRGTKPLSYMSDFYVRRAPQTWHGREFAQPYKKRINVTTSALSDDFISGFVAIVDKVVTNTPGIYMVFQMLVGGGSFKNSNLRASTAIPRRDFVFCFMFDLFYDPGMEERAEQLQSEMQAFINANYSPTQEGRLFWGTFGDPDLSKDAVRKYYYDDDATYTRLQQLKKRLDPGDLFHSLLAVKLP